MEIWELHLDIFWRDIFLLWFPSLTHQERVVFEKQLWSEVPIIYRFCISLKLITRAKNEGDVYLMESVLDQLIILLRTEIENLLNRIQNSKVGELSDEYFIQILCSLPDRFPTKLNSE